MCMCVCVYKYVYKIKSFNFETDTQWQCKNQYFIRLFRESEKRSLIAQEYFKKKRIKKMKLVKASSNLYSFLFFFCF